MPNQTQNPTGTPGLEKLESAANQGYVVAKTLKNDFNDFVIVHPDGAANLVAILAFIVVLGLSRKHEWAEKFVPGGRDSRLHTLSVGAVSLAMAVTGAVVANDIVLGAYGVQTPSLTKPSVIQVDRDLQRRPPAQPVARTVEPQREPVNPDRNARVIRLDPN